MSIELSYKETIEGLAEAIWINRDECEIIDVYDLDSQEAVEAELLSEVDTSLQECDFEKFENYKIEKVDSGGAEGDGAEMYIVFKVIRISDNAESFIQFSGRYSSWDSSYYHESYLVQPEEVMVIQWKRK